MRYQTEIIEQLVRIETNQETAAATLKKLYEAIWGNGRDGLLREYDRTKGIVQTMCWALGVIYIAVVGMVLKRWIG